MEVLERFVAPPLLAEGAAVSAGGGLDFLRQVPPWVLLPVIVLIALAIICVQAENWKEALGHHWLVTATMTLAAGATYFLSRESPRGTIWEDLFLHLAISFVVALIIIVVVEVRARNEFKTESSKAVRHMAKLNDEALRTVTDAQTEALRRVGERSEETIRQFGSAAEQALELVNEAREAGLTGLANALLPEVFVQEFLAVLRTEVLRRNVRYVVRIRPPHDGLDKNSVVLHRELSYTAENRTNSVVEDFVKSKIISAKDQVLTTKQDGETFEVPRHISLLFDGEDVLAEALDPEDPLILHYAFKLGPGRKAVVQVESEEYKTTRDTNVYTLIRPVWDLEFEALDMTDLKLELEVRTSNPNNRERLHPMGKGKYRYEGPLLPGQNIILKWRPPSGANTTTQAGVPSEAPASVPTTEPPA